MPERAAIYYDLASPYAYLAVERAGSVLDHPAELTPILLGAIFKRRGWGSWAETDQRESGMREVELRAGRYGLSPMVWPMGWPANSLTANRAATWAKQLGAVEAFTFAVYRRQFVDGADIADVEVLAAAAADAGLNPEEMGAAILRQEIKQALRQATDEAWELGVRGVPSIRVGGAIFYGDDTLEEAAAQAQSCSLEPKK